MLLELAQTSREDSLANMCSGLTVLHVSMPMTWLDDAPPLQGKPARQHHCGAPTDSADDCAGVLMK